MIEKSTPAPIKEYPITRSELNIIPRITNVVARVVRYLISLFFNNYSPSISHFLLYISNIVLDMINIDYLNLMLFQTNTI